MKTRFIQERQFSLEMGRIESDARDQCRLLEIVESACRDHARHGMGYSFARIVWKRRLLVWYEADDGGITLLSIRPDML